MKDELVNWRTHPDSDMRFQAVVSEENGAGGGNESSTSLATGLRVTAVHVGDALVITMSIV